MFFSAKEVHAYCVANPDQFGNLRRYADSEKIQHGDARWRNLTLRETAKCLADVRRKILTRPTHTSYPTKWLRPWDVVPALRDFRPAEGDFGVGIEIEYGFNTRQDFEYIGNKIKDWKYIALDYEGAGVPLEVTFPPVLYSKFGSNSQAMRYLSLLKREEARLCVSHATVGTHVNISTHLPTNDYSPRVGGVCRVGGYGGFQPDTTVNGCLQRLSNAEKLRYFNREPYGYIDMQRHGMEFKLFHSEPDTKQLVKYVEVSVALAKLIIDFDTPITMEAVRAACEAGYQLACKKTKVTPAPAVV